MGPVIVDAREVSSLPHPVIVSTGLQLYPLGSVGTQTSAQLPDQGTTARPRYYGSSKVPRSFHGTTVLPRQHGHAMAKPVPTPLLLQQRSKCTPMLADY